MCSALSRRSGWRIPFLATDNTDPVVRTRGRIGIIHVTADFTYTDTAA
jgi:hypothetical protein